MCELNNLDGRVIHARMTKLPSLGQRVGSLPLFLSLHIPVWNTTGIRFGPVFGNGKSAGMFISFGSYEFKDLERSFSFGLDLIVVPKVDVF